MEQELNSGRRLSRSGEHDLGCELWQHRSDGAQARWALGAGPGTGGGIGTGSGPGRGSGEGPGTGGGPLGDTAQATNYFAVLPLDSHPRNLDGKQLTLRFALDERGTITRVEFASTGDRGFDKKLREKMMEWKFRPAFLRSSGTPVASVYETQIGF